MRLLVVGAKGMLGSEVVRQVGARVLAGPTAGIARPDTTGRGTAARLDPIELTGLDLPDLDITDVSSVRRAFDEVQPDVVLNCAAYTDVDACETHRDEAFAVNATGPGHVAEAAKEVGALLVHISTDFVFDGAKGEPYVEDDPPGPLSAYAESKLAGEEAVRAATDRHLIVRTSWLFGAGGRNFVTAILEKAEKVSGTFCAKHPSGLSGKRYLTPFPGLRVVSDQTGCPTYAKDLALGLLAAVERGLRGTYHLCNAGATTWFELASAAVEMAGLSVEVRPIATHEWPRPARVPARSVLSCEKAWRDARIGLRPWREALSEFIRSDLDLPHRPGRGRAGVALEDPPDQRRM